MFYIGAPGFELLGASPESALLHSAATGQVAIRPIAGTRPRGLAPGGGIDHERDIRLELELRTDPKEVAEHVMLVDLARNDVARVSVPGTRKVGRLGGGDGGEHRTGLVNALGGLHGGHRVRDDTGAGLHECPALRYEGRADDDAGVEFAVSADVPRRSRRRSPAARPRRCG